jgi:surface carbohydrate biosynthesis protein
VKLHLPQLRWKIPPRKRILILDFRGAQNVQNLFGASATAIAPLAEEALVVPAFLFMLLKFRISRISYYRALLQLAKPRALVSWIDTNPWFYRIAAHCEAPSFTFQNGVRTEFRPINGKSMRDALVAAGGRNRLRCTAYFCFGESAPQMFSQLVSSDFIAAGSLPSNSVPLSNDLPIRDGIAMISSFPYLSPGRYEPIEKKTNFGAIGQLDVSFEDYFWSERHLALTLREICRIRGVPLRILGKRDGNFAAERFFYDDLLGSENYIFHENSAPYHHLQFKYECVTTVDSTLGYEMLGRGVKVAFVANRFANVNAAAESFRFGYPLNISLEGPFWTRSTDSERIRKLVCDVLDMPQYEWDRCEVKLKTALMAFDPGNVKFWRTMAQFGIKPSPQL